MAKQFDYEERSISRMEANELKQMGKEGWELVSTYHASLHDARFENVIGVFKKEIEPSIEQKQTQ